MSEVKTSVVEMIPIDNPCSAYKYAYVTRHTRQTIETTEVLLKDGTWKATGPYEALPKDSQIVMVRE